MTLRNDTARSIILAASAPPARRSLTGPRERHPERRLQPWTGRDRPIVERPRWPSAVRSADGNAMRRTGGGRGSGGWREPPRLARSAQSPGSRRLHAAGHLADVQLLAEWRTDAAGHALRRRVRREIHPWPGGGATSAGVVLRNPAGTECAAFRSPPARGITTDSRFPDADRTRPFSSTGLVRCRTDRRCSSTTSPVSARISRRTTCRRPIKKRFRMSTTTSCRIRRDRCRPTPSPTATATAFRTCSS